MGAIQKTFSAESKSHHIPVLLNESLELLDIKEGDIYLDATLGEGGHSLEIWKRFGDKVLISGIDADPQAIKTTELRLSSALQHSLKFKTLNFKDILKAPEIFGIKNPSKILFDLGWNKSQFEGGGKGFSFWQDEPLSMTFGAQSVSGFTASDIVNTWDAENIETIISAYGEERFARRIAKAIVESRESKLVKTSKELAEIIKNAIPLWSRYGRLHPATKTFQALRIAVNDELRSLEQGLKGAFEILQGEGRLAVISFHSLEDRIVKRYFKELQDAEKVEILTKRPVTASEEEIQDNPRSRSAKLRAIRKI